MPALDAGSVVLPSKMKIGLDHHLAPYKEDYVRETVMALKAIEPDFVIPMHCTGEPFYDIARLEMPKQLLRAYTGTRFVFNA